MGAHLRRNVATFVTAEGFSGLSMGLVAPMTVMAVLLHENGAQPWMIGSITAIQGGASILPQALGIYLFRSNRRRKVNLVLWSLTMISPGPLVMAALVHWSPQLGPASMCWGLFCCFLVFTMAGGTVGAVWMDWMAHLFEQRVRGRVYGVVFGCWNIAAAAAAIIAGAVLMAYPGNAGFAILYLASGLLLFVGNSIFLAARDPAQFVEEAPIRVDIIEMFSQFAHSLQRRNFRDFLIGRLLTTLGLGITPFIIIYYLSADGGELEKARIIQLSAGEWIMRSVALIGIGWIGDRWGHRFGILLGTSLQTLTLLLVVTTSGPWSCLAVYALLGLCIGASSVSHYNLLCETCPHDNRKAHIAAGNLVMLPGMILVPILAGVLVEYYGITGLMWVSLIISAVALVWFAFRFQEPRTMPRFPEHA